MPNWKMHLRVMLEMWMAPRGNDEALVLVRPHLTEGVSNSTPTLKICMEDLHVPIAD